MCHQSSGPALWGDENDAGSHLIRARETFTAFNLLGCFCKKKAKNEPQDHSSDVGDALWGIFVITASVLVLWCVRRISNQISFLNPHGDIFVIIFSTYEYFDGRNNQLTD